MHRGALLFVLFAGACVLTHPDDVEFVEDDNVADDDGQDDDGQDDDDDAQDDDDDAQDDDDDAVDVLPPCEGEAVTYQEVEPNDLAGETNAVPTGGGPFTIFGTMLACGNNGQTYTRDQDRFFLQLRCRDRLQITLDWEARTDIDFAIAVPELDLMIGADGRSVDPFEQAVLDLSEAIDVDGNGTLDLGVFIGCWEGGSGPYALTIAPL
jgi:hypothetical protein